MAASPPEGRGGSRLDRAPGGQRGNANARTHGLRTLKRAVSELGSRTIDKRTTVGRALAAWRAELVDDYGGADALSTAELALIDEAVVTKLLLGSVNAWLLEQGARLVNKRRGALVQAKVRPTPDGSRMPREKLDGVERNARWFYRVRVLGDKADDLAREYCDEERAKRHYPHHGKRQHSWRDDRKTVFDGIREAEQLLSR